MDAELRRTQRLQMSSVSRIFIESEVKGVTGVSVIIKVLCSNSIKRPGGAESAAHLHLKEKG